MKCKLESSPVMGNWNAEQCRKSPDESSSQRQLSGFLLTPHSMLLSLPTLIVEIMTEANQSVTSVSSGNLQFV